MTSDGPTLTRLAGVPAAAMVCAWAGVGVVWGLSGGGAWGWGVLAGGVCVLAALVASVPVILSVRSAGPKRGPLRLLLAGVVRLIVAVCLSVLAVAVGEYPPIATFFTLIPLYLVVMVVETRQIMGTRWAACV